MAKWMDWRYPLRGFDQHVDSLREESLTLGNGNRDSTSSPHMAQETNKFTHFLGLPRDPDSLSLSLSFPSNPGPRSTFTFWSTKQPSSFWTSLFGQWWLPDETRPWHLFEPIRRRDFWKRPDIRTPRQFTFPDWDAVSDLQWNTPYYRGSALSRRFNFVGVYSFLLTPFPFPFPASCLPSHSEGAICDFWERIWDWSNWCGGWRIGNGQWKRT
jgi:hypothetical protein